MEKVTVLRNIGDPAADPKVDCEIIRQDDQVVGVQFLVRGKSRKMPALPRAAIEAVWKEVQG